MTTSFLNIPPETPEHFRTDFLNAYADIEGTPLCTKKIRKGVEYCTGTRVYQVTRQYQHIPRLSQNMYGRTIVCIYDKQPEEKENQERKKKEKNFRKEKTDNTTQQMTPATTTTIQTKKQTKDGNNPENPYSENKSIHNIENKTITHITM